MKITEVENIFYLFLFILEGKKKVKVVVGTDHRCDDGDNKLWPIFVGRFLR